MADHTLPDGRAIDFDLGKVTRREYSALIEGRLTNAQDDEIIARAAGLTVDELGNLTQPEWRRLVRAFFKKAREPLADPN